MLSTPGAALTWDWRYSYDGKAEQPSWSSEPLFPGKILASGTLTTSEKADSNGFYKIQSIAGQRNGVAIAGLMPTGASPPPYDRDNKFPTDSLIRPPRSGESQLARFGFGYRLKTGEYVTVFFPPGGGRRACSSFTPTCPRSTKDRWNSRRGFARLAKRPPHPSPFHGERRPTALDSVHPPP